jgi:hypothetical protein
VCLRTGRRRPHHPRRLCLELIVVGCLCTLQSALSSAGELPIWPSSSRPPSRRPGCNCSWRR